MGKIKIFLGGFTNATNSQNLNCRELALRLDKTKFEVYTLDYHDGKLASIRNADQVHVFRCFKPGRISVRLGFLWGIWNADIVYLPRADFWKWNRFFLKVFRKKSFKTIEGILDADNLKSAVDLVGSYENVMQLMNITDKCYPITSFLGEYNRVQHPIRIDSRVLYLGCDTTLFNSGLTKSGNLKKVIFIGRLLKRKGIYDYLEVAKVFPNIEFQVLGEGEEKKNLDAYILQNNISNITFLGVLNHSEMAKILTETDLHILPSRSEGFPKVTLETAAAGVPSIVYGDYGASEWIATGENGWVVDTVEDIVNICSLLKQNPEQLKKVSGQAVHLAEEFDWNVRIKDWEQLIESLIKK